MRAALMVEAKQPFVVEDIDYYAPSPGRVLVRTGASPFCSTDCVNWRGELSKIPPTVLGHASMGYVEEVGENVTDLKVGDRVIVPGTSECNVCFYCSIGRPDQCSETFDRGGIWPDVAERRNGDVVNAAGNVGGYSEMMNVTANQVWAIESDLPDEWLGCLGCGITTGLGSVFHVAKVQPGQSVAIVGLGHLGQWMTQAAKVAGARTIIAVDPIAYRRELAGTLGATHVVDPSAEDSIAAVQKLTEGRGADVAIEALGIQETFENCLKAVRPAGMVSSLGVYGDKLTIPLEPFVYGIGDIDIRTTLCPGGKKRLMNLMALVKNGRLDLQQLITHRFALDDIEDAYQLFSNQEDGVIKVAVTP
jgi:S-(hydroxymethyl)glutathione dehydrogenase/alcohol dehydrogenase